MKFTIKTEALKNAVAKANVGASNNKLIPITGLIAIKVESGDLELVTTDMTNYLYVGESTVATGDDFYAVVDVNIFSKLVSKLSCDSVTLEIKSDAVLHVKGNGDYRIELPLDEDGGAIKYPDPFSKLDLDSMTKSTLRRTTAQVITDTIKPALAKTLEEPCYTGYYMSDKVVATDSYKIASIDIPMFDTPKLISSELFDLLSVIDEETIEVYTKDDDIVYKTSNCIIVGKVMEGIENFAIDAIEGLINTEFDRFCAIPKQALIQLLERLMLFVGPYDKNSVNLTFTNKGLQVSSIAANGIEIIEYVTSDNFSDFTCMIDVQNLLQEVKAIQSDVINMYYGDSDGLKLTDGNITIIIALMDDEEE